MSPIQNNSIFWVETEKIKPNPYQPRREFDNEKLNDLAESIRQYGILQPLVVTRKEIETENGFIVEYELIAGERRLRASRIAGLFQVPIIIRSDESDKIKLELAIIENLQREDLNPVDKARAFKRLVDEFNLKHHEVASRVGKSREFVSNSIRVLGLPEEILKGLEMGKITEGHTRPLLMLSDQPTDQFRIYQDIIVRKMTVKETEDISRKIASHRARRPVDIKPDPIILDIESRLSDGLGTRVQIEKIGERGKIVINFFSQEELNALLSKVMNTDSSIKPADLSDSSISDSSILSNQENEAPEDFLNKFTI